MPTECIPESFAFSSVEGRRVVAAFDGGVVTSDAGALPSGAADRSVGPIDRLAACFVDRRAPNRVVHGVKALVAQRVSGIALGHEDLNDHDELRFDPVVGALCGRPSGRGWARGGAGGEVDAEPSGARAGGRG